MEIKSDYRNIKTVHINPGRETHGCHPGYHHSAYEMNRDSFWFSLPRTGERASHPPVKRSSPVHSFAIHDILGLGDPKQPARTQHIEALTKPVRRHDTLPESCRSGRARSYFCHSLAPFCRLSKLVRGSSGHATAREGLRLMSDAMLPLLWKYNFRGNELWFVSQPVIALNHNYVAKWQTKISAGNGSQFACCCFLTTALVSSRV